MPANLENLAMATGLEKVSFHSNSKERQFQRIFKLLHNCTHLTGLQNNVQNFPRQASRVCELWNPDVQIGFSKGRRTRDQIANIHWIIEKAKEFQKHINFCFIDYAKAFDCLDHNWKFLKWAQYQTTFPASWEICMQVKKHQLELDMEQLTGSKLGRRTSRLYMVTLLI